MITLNKAKTALIADGFETRIDEDTDGLVELHASKDGFSETFFDASGECSTYIRDFKDFDSIVKYANKSIELIKRDFS